MLSRKIVEALMREYERVCDLYCVTPAKHQPYRDAQKMLAEDLEEANSKEVQNEG